MKRVLGPSLDGLFHHRPKTSSRLIRTVVQYVCCLGVIFGLVVPPWIGGQAQDGTKLRRSAQKAIRSGDFEKAEKIYRERLTKDENDFQTRLDLSLLLMKAGRWKDGYDEAVWVAQKDQQQARAYSLQGLALLRSGLFQPALEALVAAIALDRRDTIALVGLAEVDFFENRVQDAYDKLKVVTALDPQEPDHWVALGRSAARLERFKEAASYYERFLSVSPKLENEKRDRYRGLIEFYLALGRSHITQLHRVEGPKVMTLPFQLQNSRPYIQLRLNGSDPLTFVIDTGASITVLSEQAARRLKINPMAKGGHARAVGGGGSFPIVYGLVQDLSMGDVTVHNVPVYIRQLHQFSQTQAGDRLVADGFLGLSVLTNFLVTLDYANRGLTLDRRGEINPSAGVSADASVVPFRTTNGGLVSAEVQLDGREKFSFLVDSGASTTVLSDGVVEKLQWHDKLLPDLKIRVLGAAGIVEEVDLMVVPSFIVNDLEQRNVRTPVLDLNAVNETAGFFQAGIIGGSFLRNFRVTFDFQRCQLLFVPQTEAVRKVLPISEPPPQEKQSED